VAGYESVVVIHLFIFYDNIHYLLYTGPGGLVLALIIRPMNLNLNPRIKIQVQLVTYYLIQVTMGGGG
jgi:hypothetical protein